MWDSVGKDTLRAHSQVGRAMGCNSMRVSFSGRTSAFQADDTGSNPVIRSIYFIEGLAQFGEHLSYKQKVIGLSPITSAIFLKLLLTLLLFYDIIIL